MKKLAKMALNVLPDALLVAGIVAIVSSVHEMCPPLALLLSGIFAVCLAFLMSL